MPETDFDLSELGIEHRPEWPDVLPIGLVVARTIFQPLPSPPPEGSQGVHWNMRAVQGEKQMLAIVGDLTVAAESVFAGYTVHMPILLRGEHLEGDANDFTDGVLRRYGPWASSVMYDFAATGLRSMLAGGDYALEIPYITPKPRLRFAERDEPVGEDI